MLTVLNENEVTKIEFAEMRGVSPRQVYKWLARNAHLVDGKLDGLMFLEASGKANK